MVSAACVYEDSFSLPCAAATAHYLRIFQNSSGQWAICGAKDSYDAISEARTYAAAEMLSGLLRQQCGIVRMVAAAAIAALDPLWGAANGKVTNAYTEGAEFVGIAMEAASGDGVEFQVQPRELMTRVGQHTTVAASDTVATGLTAVLGAIASMESDPGDDPFMCSAAIGDQAGAPAAGSILIKTWKNTGGTDPTPLAAGTFTKKVNWIAWGY